MVCFEANNMLMKLKKKEMYMENDYLDHIELKVQYNNKVSHRKLKDMRT